MSLKNFRPFDSAILFLGIMLVVLAVVIIWLAFPVPGHASNKGRDFMILGLDQEHPKDGRVLQPHLPPAVFVRQVSGPPLPEKGSVSCIWKEHKVNGTPYLYGYCENDTIVAVSGIDLNF